MCVFQTNLGVISASTGHIDSGKWFLKKGEKTELEEQQEKIDSELIQYDTQIYILWKLYC